MTGPRRDDLIAAIDDNYAEYLAYLAATPAGLAHDDAESVWRITGAPRLFLNAVVRARLPLDDMDARIERILAPFKQRRQAMTWLVTPASSPDTLGARLAAHGLQYDPGVPGMALEMRDLVEDLPTPAGLAIARIDDEPALRAWLATLALGQDRVPYSEGDDAWQAIYVRLGFAPDRPLLQYLASLDGVPVATSEVFLGAGGVAGIYFVATVPAARRRGIGAAVVLAALREARARGFRRAVLKASDLGLNVYGRLGFVTYSMLDMYYWRPA